MTDDSLVDGPEHAAATLILAHGAGQGMDAPFMAGIARRLAEGGIRVLRFNFPYMQQNAVDGRRRPPNPEPKLLAHWRQVVDRFRPPSGLFIGGKSMGGRMASLIADELQADGLVCFGYPFHPPGKPERLRTAHLAKMRTPALICQGERDPFGRRSEVERYTLASGITLHWLEDGDHSFKPRKASGLTQDQHLDSACRATLDFIAAGSSE